MPLNQAPKGAFFIGKISEHRPLASTKIRRHTPQSEGLIRGTLSMADSLECLGKP
jgi:hypothetical protein